MGFGSYFPKAFPTQVFLMLLGVGFLLLNAFAFPMEQDFSIGSTKAVNNLTPLLEQPGASQVDTKRITLGPREWAIHSIRRVLDNVSMDSSSRLELETRLKNLQHEAKYGSGTTLARPAKLTASSELVLAKVINSAEPFKNTRMQGLENTKSLKAVATAAALSATATAGIATYVALTLNRPPLENENNSENNT